MAKRQSTLFNMPGFSKSLGASSSQLKRPVSKKCNVESSNLKGPSKRARKEDVENLSSNKTNIEDFSVDDEVEEMTCCDEEERLRVARKNWHDSWGVMFDWAKFDSNAGRIYCTICQGFAKCKSAFGTCGSINIQLCSIKVHAASKGHKWAAFQQGLGEKIIEKSLDRAKNNVDAIVLNHFRTSYFLACEEMAFLKYFSLLSFARACGTPNISSSMYLNDKTCATFIEYISESIVLVTLKKINDSPYYGIMVDESTDISNVSHMVVYVTYLELGVPKVSFLGLIEVTDHTAMGLYNALLKMIDDCGLNKHKMISFGSDGASVMVGQNGGLSTLLKQEQPFLTSIHCVAHRTNLCVTYTTKKEPYSRFIDNTLNEIAKFVKKSTIRCEKLKVLQEEFGCERYKVEKIHSIRWLSRHKVISKICDMYEPLLEFLKEENPRLFEMLADFEFIYSLHFLGDILDHLSMISNIFQRDYVDISAVPGLIVAEVIAMKMQFIIDPINNLNAYASDSRGYLTIPDYGPEGGLLYALRTSLHGNMFRGVTIRRCNTGEDMNRAINFQKAYTTHIIKNMDERFTNNSILACFKALSPAAFPSRDAMRNYGSEEIDRLIQFYGVEKKYSHGEDISSLINAKQAKKEFMVFRVQAKTEWKGWSLRDTWCHIYWNDLLKEKYTMLLRLAQIALLQCCSTAVCERGFSLQNRLKNKLRNQLNTPHLNDVMRICIDGSSIEDFDFTHAIGLWKSGAKTSRHIYGTHS